MLPGQKCFIQDVFELICIFLLIEKFFAARLEKHQNEL